MVLKELVGSGNGTYCFFLGDSLRLKDGVVISKIDFRVKRDGTGPGFLVLDIGGACLSIVEVRRHYGKLEIAATPLVTHSQRLQLFRLCKPGGSYRFDSRSEIPNVLPTLFLSHEPIEVWDVKRATAQQSGSLSK